MGAEGAQLLKRSVQGVAATNGNNLSQSTDLDSMGLDPSRAYYMESEGDVGVHSSFPKDLTTSQFNLSAIAAGRPDLAIQ